MKYLVLTNDEIFNGGYSTIAFKINNILKKKNLDSRLLTFILKKKKLNANEIFISKSEINEKSIKTVMSKKIGLNYDKIICTSPWAFYISSFYFKRIQILYIKGGGLFNVDNLNGLNIHDTSIDIDNYLDPRTLDLENKAIKNVTNYRVLPTVEIMNKIIQKSSKNKINKNLILKPLNFAWFDNSNEPMSVILEKKYDLIFIVSNHDRIIKNSDFAYKLFDNTKNLTKLVIGNNCEHYKKIPNTTVINKLLCVKEVEGFFRKSKISITSSYFDTGPSTVIESIMNGCLAICYQNCGFSQLDINGCYTMNNFNIDTWIKQINIILNNYSSIDLLENSYNINCKINLSQNKFLNLLTFRPT